MNRQNEKRKVTPGKIIAIILALLAVDSDLFAVLLAIFLLVVPVALAGYLVYLYTKKKKGASQTGKTTYASKQSFDDCPQPLFCFHKDKGEHHVARGKEMDPWDRPDIDISKYQRRQ